MQSELSKTPSLRSARDRSLFLSTVLVAFIAVLSPATTSAVDVSQILATPPAPNAPPPPAKGAWPTKDSFLAATASGEVQLSMVSGDANALGASIISVLEDGYGLPADDVATPAQGGFVDFTPCPPTIWGYGRSMRTQAASFLIGFAHYRISSTAKEHLAGAGGVQDNSPLYPEHSAAESLAGLTTFPENTYVTPDEIRMHHEEWARACPGSSVFFQSFDRFLQDYSDALDKFIAVSIAQQQDQVRASEQAFEAQQKAQSDRLQAAQLEKERQSSAHAAEIKAGRIPLTTAEDASIFFDAQPELASVSVVSYPKVTPDKLVYQLKGRIVDQKDGVFMLQTFRSLSGQSYLVANTTDHTVVYQKERLRVYGGASIVGRYIDNRHAVAPNGAESTVPVFEVLFMSP